MHTSMWRSGLAKKLEKIVGKYALLHRAEDLKHFELSAGPGKNPPDLVCRPQSAKEISQILRVANDAGASVVSKADQHSLANFVFGKEYIWLDLSGMSRIIEVDLANLCAVLQPAVKIEKLNEVLRASGFRVLAGGDNTGCIAGDLIGSCAVTGIELVLPSGRISNFGGKARDAAGYCMMGLVAASNETLGVITKITVQLSRLVAFEGKSRARLVEVENQGKCELVAKLQNAFNPRRVLNPQNFQEAPSQQGNSFVHNHKHPDVKVLLKDLKMIVGDGAQLVFESYTAPQGRPESLSIGGKSPAILVTPVSAHQVADILKLAGQCGLVVAPAGGMTQQEIGCIPEKIDLLLGTGQLREVHYDPANATISAGAGVTIAELQRNLASTPHFLPVDPMHAERATVGGVLATNAHGPLRSGYGSVRDLCVELKFVSAEGKIVEAAGGLAALMIGSVGTLGVITNAKFKLFPRPVQTRTFVSQFGSLEEAMQYRDQVMASDIRLMCLEIASPRAQEYLQEQMPARNPDIYAPLAPVSAVPWRVFVRIGGEEAEIVRGREAVGGFIAAEFHGSAEETLWRQISDWESAVTARHRNATIFHVSTAVGDVGAALAAGEQTAVEHNLLAASVGRIAAGALIVAFLPLGVDPVSAMQCAVATSAFRGRLAEDASAVVMRCPRESKGYFNVWGSTPTDMEFMRTVRTTFDPKGILNRGRFMM